MIEKFIKQLLEEKGLPPNLEPKVYDQLVKDLNERAVNLINRRLVEAMSEEQAQEFDKLLADRPDDLAAAQEFVREALPNQDAITAAALSEFRQLYLGPSR
jgi:hypothetical protein